jgi:ATP-dependent RNA helicase SUPV3L1/SUV3
MQTMQALEPILSIKEDNQQSFFLDSMPSFVDVLATNSELTPVVERLVRAGFGNGRFSKQYLRALQLRDRYEELNGRLVLRNSELASQQKQSGKDQEEMERMQLELGELYPVQNEPTLKTSLLNKALQSFGKLLQTDDEKQEQFVTKSQRDSLILLVEERQRREQANQALMRNAARHIEELEREIQHVRRHMPLSYNELTTASVALDMEKQIICQSLVQHIQRRHKLLQEQFSTIDDKTDLTKPHDWYPYARLDRRKIIFHGGPTNSGKTYEALERLKQAKKGMYLGPLRLLAAEVYEKLTAAGIYCSLYTGQEIQRVPFETHGAATVEMASLSEDYDVVVIDEIQMIGDVHRGFAWTRALLGSRCKEIHVCGGLEAKEIVERIAAACGDDFELRTYTRFTDLKVADNSLANAPDQVGSYRAVKSGDCVVAFSRKDIFAIKREIETLTAHKCCVIYGSLPPQTRTEQARLFNDSTSGYNVLVASDAVGMGLNLNIKRIVFNSMYKQDASGITHLGHSAVKQISGRAGRRNSPFPDGEVTCRSPADMAHLRKCMSTPIDLVRSAGLVPTASHIEIFHRTLMLYGLGDDLSSLHNILGHFSDMAKLKSEYFLCRQTPMVMVAQQLASIDLSIRDKYTLCMSPVVGTSKSSMEVLKRFAVKLASGEVPGLSQRLRPMRPKSFDDLSNLCSIYSDLELFLWLQNKFPPVNMMEQQAVLSRKERTIAMIGEGLHTSDKLKLEHSYVNRDLMLRDGFKSRQAKVRKILENDVEEDDWNACAEDM